MTSELLINSALTEIVGDSDGLIELDGCRKLVRVGVSCRVDEGETTGVVIGVLDCSLTSELLINPTLTESVGDSDGLIELDGSRKLVKLEMVGVPCGVDEGKNTGVVIGVDDSATPVLTALLDSKMTVTVLVGNWISELEGTSVNEGDLLVTISTVLETSCVVARTLLVSITRLDSVVVVVVRTRVGKGVLVTACMLVSESDGEGEIEATLDENTATGDEVNTTTV